MAATPGLVSEDFLAAWEVRDPAGSIVKTATTSETTFTPADNGVYTAIFTVTNSAGQSSSDTVLITVANAAPAIANPTPQTVVLAEGQALDDMAVNFTDAGQNDTGFRAAIFTANAAENYQEAGGLSAAVDQQSRSIRYSYAFSDSGAYKVGGMVADSDGGQTIIKADLAFVTVNNVAPTASLEVPPRGIVGTPVTFELTRWLDPSAEDTAAGFHFTFAFNQGDLASTYAAAGTDPRMTHTFNSPGTATVFAHLR